MPTTISGTTGINLIQSGVTIASPTITSPSITGTVSGGSTIASPSVSGALTMTTGGITFNANPGGGTQATLNDYEVGTFTPIDSSGAGLTFTFPTGVYTKIGNMVFAQARFIYPSTASGLTAEVGGFPFAAATSGVYYGAYIVYQTYGTTLQARSVAPTTIYLSVAGGTNVTNANLSGVQIQLVYIYRATA